MTHSFQHTVFYSMDTDGMLVEVLGEPVVQFEDIVEGDFTGQAKAISVNGKEITALAEHACLSNATSVSFRSDNKKHFQAFVDHVNHFSHLKALLLTDDVAGDISPLLEAMPTLECLLLEGKHQVSPTRHAELTQLVGEFSNLSDMLQRCSFPNLEVLEAGDVQDGFAETLNQIALPKLRHLGILYGRRREILAELEQLTLPPMVKSMTLAFEARSGDLRAIAKLPWAGQIEHLSMRHARVQKGICFSTKRFPNLVSLAWVPEDEGELPDFFFSDDLSHLQTVDLRYCGIDNTLAQQLLDAPWIQHVKQLNLDYNWVMNTRLQDAFFALACDVSIAHQEDE